MPAKYLMSIMDTRAIPKAIRAIYIKYLQLILKSLIYELTNEIAEVAVVMDEAQDEF